jgi:dUTP pyrophosphatase
VRIKTLLLKENARLPFRATQESAGADLYACLNDPVTIPPGEQRMIPTGIALEIPSGFGGFVFPRSSVASKQSVNLSNCVGVIDSDYRGEVSVPLYNFGTQPFHVHDGDRIAQIVIIEVGMAEFESAESLSDTERGIGGFGSTGKR